jgi:hypothetical protein
MGIITPPPSRALLDKLSNKRRVVATRGTVHTDIGGGGGATNYTLMEGRIRCKTGVACSDLQLVFSNFYAGQAAGELENANDITVRAAIELQTPQPFITHKVFFNGAASVTIAPGAGHVPSDPVGIDLPRNTEFFIRLAVGVPSGGTWPRYRVSTSASGESFVASTSSTSQVYGVGALTVPAGGAVDTVGGYFPSAVLGIADPRENAKSLIIAGDSIADGSNDSYTLIDRGFIPKGAANVDGNQIPWLRIARSAERANLGYLDKGIRRRAYFQYASHAVFHLGTNDIATGLTYAQTTTYLSSLFVAARRAGVSRIAACSILPRVTGTFTTVVGQTPMAGFESGGLRDQVNAWLAAGADGLIDRYLNVTQYVEAAGDHTRWLANATTDGVHPEDSYHVLMAAPVTDFLRT